MKGNYYSNYRSITAKFNSRGKCGHDIRKGDTIGWNRKYGAQCSGCWRKWQAENAEADLMESGQMPYSY